MNEIAPQLDDVLILGVKSFTIRIRQLVQNMRGLKLQLQAPDESSMYSSAEQSLFLQRGRTEVEYLNGEVVSLGKAVGLGLLKKMRAGAFVTQGARCSPVI